MIGLYMLCKSKEESGNEMIRDILGISNGDIVSFVGGGGKTTIMKELADELIPGFSVAITTTTHIYPVPGVRTVFEGDGIPDENPIVLAKDMDSNGKLVGILPENVKGIKRDVILIEADGSKGRSLKAPAEWEPVVPKDSTVTCVVIGLDILGKRLNGEHVHRADRVCRLTGYELNSEIDAKLIVKLLNKKGLLKGARGRVFIVLNKIDIVGLDMAYDTALYIKENIDHDIVIRGNDMVYLI